MSIDFVCRSRTPFFNGARLKEIEDVLRVLSNDFLGAKLFRTEDEDIPIGHRECHELQKDNWLLTAFEEERIRRRASLDSWMSQSQQNALDFGKVQECKTGSLYLVDGSGNKEVYLDVSEAGTREIDGELRLANSLRITWQDVRTVGENLSSICSNTLHYLLNNPLFDFGYCCNEEQYIAKNIDTTGGGMCAIGLDASRCLPGFYWSNYFGDFLCQRIGEDVLMDVPDCKSEKLSDGILVTNQLSPDQWSEDVFTCNEERAMKHIGLQYFFNRREHIHENLF